MKAKCISKKENTAYKFFLLMVAPLLIGFMIAFISLAHAEQDRNYESTTPIHGPQGQNWDRYQGASYNF